MGKPFDGMRGKNKSFNSSKFHALLNLSVSRLAVLRNQRAARCNLALSDVVQILKLGQHHRALLRVEQVVKEQNMSDVFVMMEGYCHLMEERINLIEHERECPEELKEAVASMLYASTRCGEFPELQEMRAIFTSRYGKEFVARATELRNNCGVNPKMIQKLSTRQPSLEKKLKVLKDIASENNIVLQIEEASSSMAVEGKLETEQKQQDVMEKMESFSDSMEAPRKYKDVADAAEAAFKSAAYAAAAARAAVELSKSGPHDPNDQNGFLSGKRKATNEHEGTESELQTDESNLRRMEDRKVGRGVKKAEVVGNHHSESEREEIHGKNRAEEERRKGMSGLNSDVSEGSRTPMDVEGEIRPAENESGETCRQTGNEKEGGKLLSSNHQFGLDVKPGSPMNDEGLVSKKSDTVMDENLSERNDAKLGQSEKKVHVGFRAGLKARLRAWQSM